MKRVTGLGGVFFKTDGKEQLLDWYRKRLGIEAADYGFAFLWNERDRPDETGYTVWSPFARDSDYFAPSGHDTMLNFRVADLAALLEALKTEGVEQVGEMKQEANGKFAWVLDPDGRKIELWEPVPSAEDPYLPK